MLTRLRQRLAVAIAPRTPEDLPEHPVASRWDTSPDESLDAAWAALDGLNHALGLDEAVAVLESLDSPLARKALEKMLYELLALTEREIRALRGTDQPATC